MKKQALVLLATLIQTSLLLPEPVAAREPDTNQRFGLVFVYAATCPASQKTGRALKAIAGHYNMAVLAVSTDGMRLSQWPETQPDWGQTARLGITRVPFVALYDKGSGLEGARLHLIANHAMGAAAIEHKMVTVMRESL